MSGKEAGSSFRFCPAGQALGASGKVTVTRRDRDRMELMIYGSAACVNAVVGSYMSGQYICIPDIDVGCPLSSFSDIFWNRERLSAHMQKTDAEMVAYALKALSEYLDEDWVSPPWADST